MMDTALINKHRPRAFSEVVGQAAVVKALRHALEEGIGSTFLFSGPSGVGKTTLARLAASAVGCQPSDLIEIDGASATGIDAMREIALGLQYRPLGVGAVKAVIVDECHALSKPAFQSLLKILEEPPIWAKWFLCTTEPTKVPEAVRTRCVTLALKPVKQELLEQLLIRVAEQEGLKADPVLDDILVLCAKEAAGSPRQALSNLTTCLNAKTLNEAAELLRSAAAVPTAIDLVRLLVKGSGWGEAQRLLADLAETGTNPESVRHVIRAYVTKVVLGAKSEAAAGRGVEILDAFAEPFNTQDGLSPLVLACGRLLLR